MTAALQASLSSHGWVGLLPWVLPGLRSAPKEDLQASAEMVYGQMLWVTGGLIPDSAIPGSAVCQQADFRDKE